MKSATLVCLFVCLLPIGCSLCLDISDNFWGNYDTVVSQKSLRILVAGPIWLWVLVNAVSPTQEQFAAPLGTRNDTRLCCGAKPYKTPRH